MKKFLKIATISIASLILLLILAVIILPIIIDVNSFKPEITKIVSEQTGRELTIDGEIKLKILPRLSIELSDITFSNADGFEAANMANIGRASFGVALFPILKKEIRITRIILEDTELYYAVNAEGVTNIDDILALQAAKAEAAPKEPAPEPEAEKAPVSFNLENINVALLRISNMTVSYNDERLSVQYLLSNAGVEATDVGLAKPVDITMQAQFQELKSQMAAGLDMAATVSFDGSLATANLAKLQLSYSAPESGLNVTANLVANTAFNLDTQVAELSNTVLDVVASMQSADFALDSDVKLELPAASFDLAKSYLDLPAMNVSGGYTVSMIEGRQSLSAALSKLTFDMQKETMNLESFNLQTMGVNVNTVLAGEKLLSAPDIKGSLRLGEFSPRSVLSKLKVDYTPSDANALTKFGLATDFTFANNVLNAPLALVLDSTKINVSATVNLAGDKPVIKANTELDAIILDKYLPAATQTAAAEASTPTAAPAPAQPAKLEYPNIAMDLSTAPDFTIAFKAGKISFQDEALNALAINANGKDGLVDVSMGTSLNQGAKINADAHITAQPNKFNAAANLSIASLDLHKALKMIDPKMDLSIIPKKGAVSLSANMGNKALTLSKLNVTADAITVAGNAKLDFAPANKPLATFRFDINRINVRDFLPATPASAKPETAAQVQQKADAATNAPEINLPLDADGVVTLRTLTYDKIVVSNISAAMKVKDNNISIAPLSGNVWGGSFSISGSVASKGGKLPAALKLNLANIKAEEAIRSFKPNMKVFSGALTLNADFTTKGLTPADLRTSINGRGEYALKGGTVHGIAYDRDKMTLNELRSLSLFGDDKSTTIRDLKGSLVFENGRITFSQVDMSSNSMSASLKGGVMLTDFTLNFDGTLDVDKVAVPISITGPIIKPNISINRDKLIEGLVKQFSEKAADAVKEKVQEKIEEEIKDKITDKIPEDVKEKAKEGINNAVDGLKNLFNR